MKKGGFINYFYKNLKKLKFENFDIISKNKWTAWSLFNKQNNDEIPIRQKCNTHQSYKKLNTALQK